MFCPRREPFRYAVTTKNGKSDGIITFKHNSKPAVAPSVAVLVSSIKRSKMPIAGSILHKQDLSFIISLLDDSMHTLASSSQMLHMLSSKGGSL